MESGADADDGALSAGGPSGDENYFQGYTFTDRSHSSRVVKSIMDLCLEDGLFADVIITVDSKEFQLHRLVLSAQSCFFRSMFTSNLREAFDRNVELKDVSAAVFQSLVDYIYHGTVKLRVDNLQDTYEMADMYQLTALFEECSRFLSRTVNIKNCLQVKPSNHLMVIFHMHTYLTVLTFQVMWLADRHSDQELYTAAKHCAKIHLVQLHQTEEFLNLPLCLLIDIIKGPKSVPFFVIYHIKMVSNKTQTAGYF